MKDKIYQILAKHSFKSNEGDAIHWLEWDKVAEDILAEVIGIEVGGKKQIEKDFLEMFNRIKKSFHEKRGKKFTPTRTVSKPSQLHARLKDYTIEELGKVIYAVFNDPFHAEKNWKFVTTEYVTRTQNLEKYL